MSPNITTSNRLEPISMSKVSISDKRDQYKVYAFIPPPVRAQPNYRTAVEWVPPLGTMPLYALRASIDFDPAYVRRGDRIGSLTVVSDPSVFRSYSLCCGNWKCKLDRPVDRSESASCVKCGPPISLYYADMLCDCGEIISSLKLRGDWSQYIACRNCYRQARYGMVA